MDSSDTDSTAYRRSVLAQKGRCLYDKFCGTGGRGICAESFAVYHIGRDEGFVAEDLIDHLDARITALENADPCGRLEATRGLVARIRGHLQTANERGSPDCTLPQTGLALRRFVLCNSSDC